MNLHQCRIELDSIIRELRDIETGIRNDFRGIHQESIANTIGAVASRYQNQVLNRLDNVDQNRIVEVWETIRGRNG